MMTKFKEFWGEVRESLKDEICFIKNHEENFLEWQNFNPKSSKVYSIFFNHDGINVAVDTYDNIRHEWFVTNTKYIFIADYLKWRLEQCQ